jgi:hypothetical protein
MMTDDDQNAIAAARFPTLERSRNSEARNRCLIDWAFAIICWDGLLPIAVIGVPGLIAAIFPRAEVLHIIAYVFFPIGAFFLRLRIGRKYFDASGSYSWQKFLFVVSIFFLVILETTLILFHELNNQAEDDWIMLGKVYLIYLATMSIAMLPIRKLCESANN